MKRIKPNRLEVYKVIRLVSSSHGIRKSEYVIKYSSTCWTNLYCPDLPEARFNGLPVSRLFEFNQMGNGHYILITTPEHFEADLRFFRRKCKKVMPDAPVDFLTTPVREKGDLCKIHTVCHGCAFTTYQGKTQVNCELGRTDVFREQGHLIEACDGDDEFFIVNGRTCKAKRGKRFAEMSKVERIQAVHKQLQIKFSIIIVCQEFEDVELEATLGSLLLQELKPTQILVADARKGGFAKMLQFLRPKLDNQSFQWEYVSLRQEVSREEEVVDVVMPKVKGDFYVVLKPGQTLSSNVFDSIDTKINYRLEQFVMVVVDGIPIVQVAAHKHPLMDGNRPIEVDGQTLNNIYEKLTFFASRQGRPDMVKNCL